MPAPGASSNAPVGGGQPIPVITPQQGSLQYNSTGGLGQATPNNAQLVASLINQTYMTPFQGFNPKPVAQVGTSSPNNGGMPIPQVRGQVTPFIPNYTQPQAPYNGNAWWQPWGGGKLAPLDNTNPAANGFMFQPSVVGGLGYTSYPTTPGGGYMTTGNMGLGTSGGPGTPANVPFGPPGNTFSTTPGGGYLVGDPGFPQITVNPQQSGGGLFGAFSGGI